jgi:hypothetical protein
METTVICPPYSGTHCYHWGYTWDACCYCGSTTDSDDDKCPGESS